MIRGVLTFLLTAVVVMCYATSASAVKAKPALYATIVEMHFSGPNGKSATIVQTVMLEARQDCTKSLIIPVDFKKHPEAAGMKLTGMKCRDGSGGKRPSGPAIVYLFFVRDGHVVRTTVDHYGAATFDTKTCAFDLPKIQDALVKQVHGQFFDAKFVRATCVPRPKYGQP